MYYEERVNIEKGTVEFRTTPTGEWREDYSIEAIMIKEFLQLSNGEKQHFISLALSAMPKERK